MPDPEKSIESSKPTGVSSGFEERRATQRLDVELEVSAVIVSNSQTYLFKTADISAGGLRFLTDKAITVGEIMKLFIPLVKHQKPLEVTAKVVWFSRAAEDSYVGGAMFLDISPPAVQEISQFISNAMLNRYLDTKEEDSEEDATS